MHYMTVSDWRGLGRRLAAVVVILALGAAACGDDDQSVEDAASDAPSAEAAATAGDVAAASGESAELGVDHDGPVNPCGEDAPADALELEGEPASGGATILDVVAIDHEFQGLGGSYPEGPYGLRMTNSGAEVHEMAVMRIDDDETRPISEIATLPQEEAAQVTEYVGGSVACPGQTAEALGVDMTPGRYVLLSFIPLGLTPEVPATEEAFKALGPPQFTSGMVAEILVTGS
ncbi:MAG: hypothetical protein ACR2PK_16060 [Acidimicrobiales bacterium]